MMMATETILALHRAMAADRMAARRVVRRRSRKATVAPRLGASRSVVAR